MGVASACSALLLLFLAAVATKAAAKTLPSYITICNRSNDRELSKCGLKNTVDVQPHIAKGIPELSLPAMDPLNIPQIKLEQGTQAVNYKCVLDSVKLYGLSQYKFLELDSKMEGDYYIKGTLSLPLLYLIADYELDGKVLLVPIKGKGIYTGNYTDTVCDIDIRPELFEKKGKQYLRVKDTSVKLTVGKTEGHFENLGSGDSTLTQATNTFLNDNADRLRDETLPAVQQVVAKLVEQILNQVFNALPYEELFPK